MHINSVFSGFAVDDVDAAEAFYTDVLGLTVTRDDEMLSLQLGDAFVLAYPKEHHTPADFTILNLDVDDIEAAVDELVGKGVTFERYDEIPADERGIMREGGPYIAWFRDPAGNVMSVLQQR